MVTGSINRKEEEREGRNSGIVQDGQGEGEGKREGRVGEWP